MPASRRRCSVASKRARRAARWPARAASNASSSGSTPSPSTCSSPPGISSPSPRVTALISTPGTRSRPAGTPAGGHLAVSRQVVVVGDREQPHAGVERLAHELVGLEDAVGARRVGVGVARSPTRRRGSRVHSPSEGAWRSVTAVRPRRAAGAARSGAPGRWPGRRRPGTALQHDRALPHLEPRRQRVDEPRQDRLRVEADDAPQRARSCRGRSGTPCPWAGSARRR